VGLHEGKTSSVPAAHSGRTAPHLQSRHLCRYLLDLLKYFMSGGG
jgi:hypothetical protein